MHGGYKTRSSGFAAAWNTGKSFVKSLVFIFYKYLLMPLLYVLLQVIRPFSKGKLRELLDDKNRNFTVCKDAGMRDRRPVWIHAASGEIEYARSIIRELRAQAPNVPILVTYSSPSAKKILAGLDIDAWSTLPWDFEFCFESFLKLWNPRVLLVSRTDVWPVMAASMRKNKIPSYLFSATFADNSSRLRGLTRLLTAYSLDQLSGIFCVSEEDVRNIQNLNLKTNIQSTGDTRFDQVLHRLNHPKELKLSLRPKGFTVVFGSTWPEDEKQIWPILGELQKENVKFIFAPHETTKDHLQHIEEHLKKNGLSYCFYSRAERWQEEDVLIVDQVGILAEIYTWGNCAFVGGSFRRQVHSVMEPLAAGLPVMVGPFHQNNREALFYQNKSASEVSLVQCVQNSNELLAHIKKIAGKDISEIQKAVLLEIYKNQGSTQKLFALIGPQLLC